jgi:hypothetical protein
MTLNSELCRLREKIFQQVTKETVDIMTNATKRLKASNLSSQALGEKDKAPDFELPNVEGKMVSSSKLLEHGPLVISFFRGSW